MRSPTAWPAAGHVRRAHEPARGRSCRPIPAALEQVVANLLDNAVKYSRRRPATVTVRVRAERLVGDRRGHRSRRGHRARPTRRGSSSASIACPAPRHRQGFGLGLPIVRELVHAQGGRVDVSSAPGVGSTFRVTLRCITAPRRRRDADAAAISRRPRHDRAARRAPTTPATCSSSRTSRRCARCSTDNLEFEGYRVTAVASGEEALQACRDAGSSRCCCVDVMLPGMSGFDVCQQLRARGTHVPIVVLTARTHEQDRIRGLDLGADDYVSKPFSVRELLARVRAQVRRDDWHSPSGERVHARRRRGEAAPAAGAAQGPPGARCRRASSSCCATCSRTATRWSAASSCCATSGATASCR